MQTFDNLEDLIDSCDFYGPLTVADFGAGAGFFTLPIAKRISNLGKIYAMDIQEPPLEALRKKVRTHGFHNVQTMRVDLEAPSGSKLKEESVDRIIIANILFQAPDKKAILAEAHRILKKSGKIIIVEWESQAQTLLGPRHETRIKPEALKNLLTSMHLAIIKEFGLGGFHYGLIVTKAA